MIHHFIFLGMFRQNGENNKIKPQLSYKTCNKKAAKIYKIYSWKQ